VGARVSRPVNPQAEYDARGADDERATDPGAYRAPRPVRPVVSRWRPTRYASIDGIAWAVASAPRAWNVHAPTRPWPPARATIHARAAAVGAASREFTVGIWCAAGCAALLLAVVTSAL
jgi:hypothetical protein